MSASLSHGLNGAGQERRQTNPMYVPSSYLRLVSKREINTLRREFEKTSSASRSSVLTEAQFKEASLGKQQANLTFLIIPSFFLPSFTVFTPKNEREERCASSGEDAE